MKNIVLTGVVLTTMISFTACNGGGGGGGGGGSSATNNDDGSSANPTHQYSSGVGTINGVILDSVVSGLEYSTPSQGSGTTTGSGQFTCVAGEQVTFKLGGFTIGQSECLATVTPISFVTDSTEEYFTVSHNGDGFNELSSGQNEKLGRILMLLQTIDNDGNASNGIVVDSNASTAIQAFVSTQSEFDAILNDQTQAEYDQSMRDLATGMGGATVAQDNIYLAGGHFKTTFDNIVYCDTSDISNSSSVAGTTMSCVATACISGYTLINGACVDNSAPVAEKVVSDAIDFYNDWSSTNDGYIDFVNDYMAHTDCSGASSFSTMKALYADRDTNSFLTSGAYSAEQLCIDRMSMAIKSYIVGSLDRETDLLEVTGATDSSASFFNADGTITGEEEIVIGLMFDWHSAQ